MNGANKLHLPKEDLMRFAAAHDPLAPAHAHVLRHLKRGCETCAAWVARYAQAAASPPPQSSGDGPPAAWIRPRQLRQPTGVRAGLLADTSLVCGAGPYEVDVLVRQFEAPRSLEIAGQITRAGQIHEPISDLPVALVEPNATNIVTATSTDSFGEFDLAADLESPYGLLCGRDEDAPCILVWEGAFA